MKKSQKLFISMCLALKIFNDKYKTELDKDVVITRLFNEFFTENLELEEAVQVQKGYTSEGAKQKQKEEDEMIEVTVRLASKGYVYGVENNLPGLLETFSVTGPGLQKLGDIEVHSTCLNINEVLLNIDPDAIAAYGITSDDLINHKKEIDDFKAFIAVPRAKILTRAQATTKIKQQIHKMKTLLSDRLDKMIYSLPASQEVLKNEYRAARSIASVHAAKPSEAEPTAALE